jgi:hypothetical protein
MLQGQASKLQRLPIVAHAHDGTPSHRWPASTPNESPSATDRHPWRPPRHEVRIDRELSPASQLAVVDRASVA